MRPLKTKRSLDKMKDQIKKRPEFTPCGMATGIGSLPHTDPAEAVNVLLERLEDAPFWPQLPRLSYARITLKLQVPP